ncbi:MAG TPA: tetratricopeptide repeat protein [Thermoanaerobaculia bacterium]|nr:tetratricopeptide repeat protein [Thermoanaerobaculia bacterium]
MLTAAILLLTLQAAPASAPTGQELLQQGIARHDAGDYQGAIAALEKARSSTPALAIPVGLRLARSYAQAGRTADALQALEQIVQNGYQQADQLNAENDLLSIRTDARWSAIITRARQNGKPCTASPEFRQFDYWLGEWDVERAGQKIARSSIQLILEECVVFENYYAFSGYSGKSFSAWDAMDKRWEQQYADTSGGVRTWTGSLVGDRMVFFLRGQGQGVSRMTYIKEGPDKVRQLIEVSTDGEKSWSPGFDGMYVRRK